MKRLSEVVSELSSEDIPPEEPIPEQEVFEASDLADPPISMDEVRAAKAFGDHVTVCRWHKGHISHSPTQADTNGRIFYCPIGRMWWRYTKQTLGLSIPLSYNWKP